MSIILAILVFGFLIFIHELGHFVAAKLSGITVYSFSIGFGPAILKKQVGDTLYAIRILPFVSRLTSFQSGPYAYGRNGSISSAQAFQVCSSCS